MSVLCYYLHFTISLGAYPAFLEKIYINNKTFSFSCRYSSEFRGVFGLHTEPNFHRWENISAERQRYFERYIRCSRELRNIFRCRRELRVIYIYRKSVDRIFCSVGVCFDVFSAAAAQSEQLIQPSVNIARRYCRSPRVARISITARIALANAVIDIAVISDRGRNYRRLYRILNSRRYSNQSNYLPQHNKKHHSRKRDNHR